MKVLAFVNAHSLAHVTRPLEIAKELRSRGHLVIFAGIGQYLFLTQESGFNYIESPYFNPEDMLKATVENRLWNLFPEKDLQLFIDFEIALIEKEKPDLILNDCRMTANTSAEFTKTPIVTIVNAHMTNQREIPFYVMNDWFSFAPEILKRGVDKIENIMELTLYHQLVLKGICKLRKKYGLPTRFGYENECSSLNLIPDLPEFNPIISHSHYQYVGPLMWKNHFPAPKCLEKLRKDCPVVYLSIGSNGLDSLLENTDLLKSSNLQFIVAAGKNFPEEKTNLMGNVFIEKFINVDLVLPNCDLVVCHGGNGTIYQALKYGLPILGFSTHAEQAFGLKRLQYLGLGEHFKVQVLKERGISFVVKKSEEMLANDLKTTERKKWQNYIAQWKSAEICANKIEEYLDMKLQGQKLKIPG
jgi:UDP:flavonoid glycosyltransferase YjiC (YdhE family)